MTFENGKGYRQWNERKNGKVISHHVPVEKTKKLSAYEIAVGDEVEFFDGKISKLYTAGLGANKIAGILQYEDGIQIKKNPVTRRLKELGIYKGDRRNKAPQPVDHQTIVDEKNAEITELRRALERNAYLLEVREGELDACKKAYSRVHAERNESDKKLRLIAEGIPVVEK